LPNKGYQKKEAIAARIPNRIRMSNLVELSAKPVADIGYENLVSYSLQEQISYPI
jgi:hypothetical protein